jgi:hypothetical protein
MDGLTANGGTYIAAMDRSAQASFVMKAQSQDYRTKLENAAKRLERILGIASRWTTSSEMFQVQLVSTIAFHTLALHTFAFHTSRSMLRGSRN